MGETANIKDLKMQVITGKIVKKANGVKTLVSVGAWYKDDCDDGWSFSMGVADEPVKGSTRVIYDGIIEAGDELIRDVESGEITVEWLKGQMAYSIEQFNIRAVKSTTRPLRCEYQMDLKDRETREAIIAIGTDIYALQARGEIKEDNYNGMQYCYIN